MDNATITVTVVVGTKWGHDDVLREVTVTCDEREALKASALNISDAVKQSAYAAVCEYLDNLKRAEEEQAANA